MLPDPEKFWQISPDLLSRIPLPLFFHFPEKWYYSFHHINKSSVNKTSAGNGIV
jgi:hypothetical protein